jgi:hypothetical protein
VSDEQNSPRFEAKFLRNRLFTHDANYAATNRWCKSGLQGWLSRGWLADMLSLRS